MKKTLPLVIAGIVLLVLASFLFIINVLMLGNVIGKTPAEVAKIAEQPGLIGYLAGHLTVYGLFVVCPFLLSIPLGVFCLVFGLIRGKAIDRQVAREQK